MSCRFGITIEIYFINLDTTSDSVCHLVLVKVLKEPKLSERLTRRMGSLSTGLSKKREILFEI